MTDPRPGTDATVRLVFEFRGDDVRLVAQTPVDTAPTRPPGDPSAPGEFVEVRTQAEEPLGRAVVAHGIGAGAEVFPEDHGDPITRTDLPEARGAFTVVVPVPPDADHVSVVRVRGGGAAAASGTPGAPGAPPPAAPPERVELGSFRLAPR